jgi:hypothetical protein
LGTVSVFAAVRHSQAATRHIPLVGSRRPSSGRRHPLAAVAELRGPAYRLRIMEICGSFEGLGRLR